MRWTGRDRALLGLAALIGLSGLLVALGPSAYRVDLDSVVQLWADLIRDADRPGLMVTRVSADREMEIGRTIEEDLAARWAIDRDPAAREYVAAVGAGLTPHVRRPEIRYRFHVVESGLVNAFAIPGGVVYVTSGLLELLESEAELAAVIGHEIAHIDLGHAIERLQYELALRRIGLGDLGAVAGIGYLLVGLGFSEQQELEADGRGAILAARAEYDPRAAVAVFARFSEHEDERRRERPRLMTEELGRALGDAVRDYFATHPPSARRIRNLETVLARNERSWRGRRVYVGRWNHRERVPRSQHAPEAEWRAPD